MTEASNLAVRDRLLALIADRLGKEEDGRLVLKGGTLLRLCAFEHCRHSEDLDFSPRCRPGAPVTASWAEHDFGRQRRDEAENLPGPGLRSGPAPARVRPTANPATPRRASRACRLIKLGRYA